MGVQTAASVYRENLGSLTLQIVSFTSVASADTYASGLGTAVVGYWAQSTTSAGTGTDLAGVNVSNSSGTFTFSGPMTASAITLYIVSRS